VTLAMAAVLKARGGPPLVCPGALPRAQAAGAVQAREEQQGGAKGEGRRRREEAAAPRTSADTPTARQHRGRLAARNAREWGWERECEWEWGRGREEEGRLW